MSNAPWSEQALLWFHRHAALSAVLLWTSVYAVSGWAETRTMQIEYARLGIELAHWEIPTWQYTSGLSSLMLVGLVGWAEARWPLRWGVLRPNLFWHAGMSVVYCLIHVCAMVALRKLVYAWHGEDYDFGYWPREIYFEYLKDVRSYAVLVLVFHYSRALMRRAQGEARLLDPPEAEEAQTVTTAQALARPPKRFVVRKLGREFLVDADCVDAALASANYVNLHVDRGVYPLRSTMAQLEAQLDKERFLRVHRSAIVRLDAIAVVEPGEGGEAGLHLRSGLTVPCSRRYRAILRERLGR
jgi:hypothetical protein